MYVQTSISVFCFMHFQPQLQANSPKPGFAFSVGLKPNISPGLDHMCQHDAEAGPRMNSMS